MKYEEWIKYERIRLRQANKLAWTAWVRLPAQDLRARLTPKRPASPGKLPARLWSRIVQYVSAWNI